MSEIQNSESSAERQSGGLSELFRKALLEKLEELERVQTQIFKRGDISYDTHMFIREHIHAIYNKVMEDMEA